MIPAERIPSASRRGAAPPPGAREEARESIFGEVARAVGEHAAVRLIADFGGRRVYVPVAPAAGDLLSRSIGLPAARSLARHFGGERVPIPSSAVHAARRPGILAMRAQGVSISRIAHQLRCTERYVYKVLAFARSAGGAGREH
ncbi:MAG: hypothetical protein ACREQI_11125 [Candidatus Binataceae bacterium]